MDYGPFTLSHAYDYYANGLKKSYTGPNGSTRTYSYDKANRPTALLLPNGKEIAFTGYIWNRPEHITFPGGATLNFNYNGLQQQTAFLAADPGGASLYESNDIHALDGQIVTKETLHGLYEYGYDDATRLVTAETPQENQAYTYDGLGNRLTSSDFDNWQYNANNQLQTMAQETSAMTAMAI
jgi:large repetitive protein